MLSLNRDLASHETESETIHSHVMCVCVMFAHRHINNNNFEGNIDAIKDLTNLEKLCVWSCLGLAKGIIEKQNVVNPSKAFVDLFNLAKECSAPRNLIPKSSK